MKTRNIILILSSSLFLVSCANMARGIFTPNQCKECSILSKSTGETITSFEGCGASNVRIYEDAAVYAYEHGCDATVSCRTWKEDSE